MERNEQGDWYIDPAMQFPFGRVTPWKLGAQASAEFVRAVLHPAAPTDTLTTAVARYNDAVKP